MLSRQADTFSMPSPMEAVMTVAHERVEYDFFTSFLRLLYASTA